jgi:hypothetical protein
MAVWEVRDRDAGVEVEAPNWMMAIGSAMAELGSDGLDMACLICDVQADGVVRIYDPRQDRALLVRRVDAPAAAPPAPATVAVAPECMAEAPALPSTPTWTADDDTLDPDALPPAAEPVEDAPPPPTLQMPTGPSAALLGDIAIDEPSANFDEDDMAFVEGEVPLPEADGPPEDLAEQLFDGGMDIAGADSPAEACAAALSLLARFVPAESACVLGAGINDTALRFLAVTGPAADEVRHIQVPFHSGIAGFCHTTGADLIVTDAAADPRHHAEIDASSGYRTRGVLAVALRDQDGDIHGCIELLNPPQAFTAWHLDAATSVAQTLAAYLGPRI